VHENVARIWAVFLEKCMWIVSEYAEYGTARSVMQTCFAGARGLGEEETVAMLGQAAQGLAFMHASSYLHRDVCGNNFLVCRDGTVKLAGSYAVLAAEASRELVGTLTHAAPEVVWGTDYASACDVWSLGIAALELLHGVAPHQALSPPLRIVQAIVHGETPDISASVAVSAPVAALVRSCLQRDPALRPSAAQVAAALQRNAPKERIVAFLRELRVPLAAEAFAAARPDLADMIPPDYVPAPPLSNAQISAAISQVSKQQQKKSKAEPQLMAINSNPDVSPTIDRLPVAFPATAQDAKPKKHSLAVGSVQAPTPTMVSAASDQTSPQLERVGSSEVKKIGKFTVTTTTPSQKMTRQASFSSNSSSGLVSPTMSTTTQQQGKFTITTVQHGPMAPPSADESPRTALALSAVRPALEMLLAEQRDQSRLLLELVQLASKHAEELRLLREENSKLRARLDRKE
jgi:serine/threonine protein kinase